MHGRIQERACTTSCSNSFQGLGLSLLDRNLKKVDFTDKDFLHKKLSNKDVYVDYFATKVACSLTQYKDLTALNRSK